MSSLAYQQMPHWLLEPLMAQAISLAEASETWDEYLLLGEPDKWRPDSPRMLAVAMRINLLEDETHLSPGH